MSLPLPPIQTYRVKDKEVFVVRDDLTSLFPAPNNSKIRGVYRYLSQLREEGVKNIASQDTRISRCGWAVSYVAQDLGMMHFDFYPQEAENKPIPFYQRMSRSLGAEVIPLRGNHASVMRVHAKRWLDKKNINAIFLPNGLSMPESTLENARVVQEIEKDIFGGSLIACVSSGTILSGVLHGLECLGNKVKVYGVLTSSFKNRADVIIGKIRYATNQMPRVRVHSRKWLGDIFEEAEDKRVTLELVDLKYKYHQTITEAPPFPCDLYLDRKAWKFIVDNVDTLPEPIVFWNVGGEWDPYFGLKDEYRGDGIVTRSEIEEVLKESEL